MSNFREKAEAQTKRIIGQMIGDDLLVREGQEQSRNAESTDDQHEPRARDTTRIDTMAKQNDQAARNEGRERGLQTGMPKPHPPRAGEQDQGIVRDERGQEQPRDKKRAQRVSRVDRGGDPPGKRM